MEGGSISVGDGGVRSLIPFGDSGLFYFRMVFLEFENGKMYL